MSVIVYGRKGCVQCEYTTKVLDQTGVNYRAVNVDEDAKARAMVEDRGVKALPFVTAGDSSWLGFRPDKLRAL